MVEPNDGCRKEGSERPTPLIKAAYCVMRVAMGHGANLGRFVISPQRPLSPVDP